MLNKANEGNSGIDQYDDFEKLLSDMLKEENAPRGNIQTMKAAINPLIQSKSLQLKKRHGQRKESRLLALIYIVFTFLAAFLLWNYITYGYTHIVAFILKVIGVVSAMLLLCLPLLLKFKINISQRGES